MQFERETIRRGETALYLVACYFLIAVVLSGCGAQLSMTGAHVGAGFQSARVGLVVDPSRIERRGEVLPLVNYDRAGMNELVRRSTR